MNYIKYMEQCISCGACTEHCDFLKKYKLNYSTQNLERLKELSFHCFLCGECKAHCPKEIDGREIMKTIRSEQAVQNGGKPATDGFEKMIEEKEDYIYKNYHHAGRKSVLFIGCNFPAYFPETTKRLIRMFEEDYDIGTVYDCCGKPMTDLGLGEKSAKLLEERLRGYQIEEVIAVCPNCYAHLKERLPMKVITILEKLKELGIGQQINEPGARIFKSCPDREDGEWVRMAEKFFASELQCVEDVQCCGLGGCAKAKEPEIAHGFAEKLAGQNYPYVYTYCASCAGNLTRNGCGNVRHILQEILGFPRETADIYRNGENRKNAKNW